MSRSPPTDTDGSVEQWTRGKALEAGPLLNELEQSSVDERGLSTSEAVIVLASHSEEATQVVRGVASSRPALNTIEARGSEGGNGHLGPVEGL